MAETSKHPDLGIDRMFSNVFAGIAPSAAPIFIAAQLVGGGLGLLSLRVLYPGVTAAQASEVAVERAAAPSGG